MSGPREDGRCRRAISILTELCQKKSLPSLDLDTCREFLLLPSDQSLIISEPGTAPAPVCWRVLVEGRRDVHPLQGRKMFGSPVLDPGVGPGTPLGGSCSFHMFHGEVLGQVLPHLLMWNGMAARGDSRDKVAEIKFL